MILPKKETCQAGLDEQSFIARWLKVRLDHFKWSGTRIRLKTTAVFVTTLHLFTRAIRPNLLLLVSHWLEAPKEMAQIDVPGSLVLN
jgi:hypothetical protein